jgi:hypothetical protein
VPLVGAVAALSVSVAIASGFNHQDEATFTPAAAVRAEEDWRVYTPPLDPPRFLYLPAAQDELGSAPAPSRFEDDSWRVYQPSALQPLATLWAENDQIVPQPALLPVDEEPWQVYTPPFQPAKWLAYQPEDQVTTPPAQGVFEDDSWRVYTPPQEPTRSLAWQADDEITAAPATPRFDDDSWQVYTPKWASVHVTLWSENDQIVPQPAPSRFDDDSWQVYTPKWASVYVTLWSENDQIVPQPAPLRLDEEPWQVYTPPLLASKPLYLPDPEVIPAGSLVVPVPIEETPHRPHRASIRPVAEGYGVAPGVEARGEVGTPKVHAPKRKGKPGIAVAAGEEGPSEVGATKARGGLSAKAIPGGLRPVRGSLGDPLPHAAGHAYHVGLEGEAGYGRCVAHGVGSARVRSEDSTGQLGGVIAKGVTNPTAEEMIAIVKAVRAQRRKREV